MRGFVSPEPWGDATRLFSCSGAHCSRSTPLPHVRLTVMRYLAIFSMVVCLCDSLNACVDHSPPNYEAMTLAADIVIEGIIEDIKLPTDWQGLTWVSMRVEKVSKGDILPGSNLILFHEPTKLEPIEEGEGKTYYQHRSRCPSLPRSIKSARYKIWAKWDQEKKGYFVPTGTWMVHIEAEQTH